jgi:hypothetical protein
MSIPMPDFTISPRQYSDDDAWFGLVANPAGSVNVPITDPYQLLSDPAAPWHDTERHRSRERRNFRTVRGEAVA